MNFIFAFGVAHRHELRAKESGSVEALLTVVIARAFLRDRRAGEHLFGIGKIKAMFFQVCRALRTLPCEFYELNYTYKNIYRKKSALVGRHCKRHPAAL